VYDISLKSMNFKLNQARLKLGVSLILGHGVVLLSPSHVSAGKSLY